MRQKLKRTLFINGYSEAELGFSLIEILLSIAITILLVDFLMHIVVTVVKKENVLTESIAMLENRQFSEFMLGREIQTAGFCGCNRLNHLKIQYHLRRRYFPIAPIRVFSKDAAVLSKDIHPESDILVIEKMSEKSSQVRGFLKSKGVIKASLQERFDPNEPLMIANCEQADIFIPDSIKQGVSYQSIFSAIPMNYQLNAQIGKVMVIGFFVEKTHRKNQQGKPIYGLYTYDFVHHRKAEYLSGVDKMEFFYSASELPESQIFFERLLQDSDLSKIRLIKIVLTFNYEKKQEILIALRELI